MLASVRERESGREGGYYVHSQVQVHVYIHVQVLLRMVNKLHHAFLSTYINPPTHVSCMFFSEFISTICGTCNVLRKHCNEQYVPNYAHLSVEQLYTHHCQTDTSLNPLVGSLVDQVSLVMRILLPQALILRYPVMSLTGFPLLGTGWCYTCWLE